MKHLTNHQVDFLTEKISGDLTAGLVMTKGWSIAYIYPFGVFMLHRPDMGIDLWLRFQRELDAIFENNKKYQIRTLIRWGNFIQLEIVEREDV